MNQVNTKSAERLVMDLMEIHGKSGEECAVADYIRTHLTSHKHFNAKAMTADTAHRRSPFGGSQGNLIVKLPGSKGRTREPRRMLMAHMDTVPICVDSQPTKQGQFIRSKDKTTGLGADDRAGCAAILAALSTLLQEDLSHPPLTFMWTVQEEVGLIGARHCSVNKLGKPTMAFNFDGGSPGDIVIGATGAYRMSIRVEGIASHAGGHPEDGVSAIAIASLAIADLVEDGWHGAIDQSNKIPTKSSKSGKKQAKRKPSDMPGKQTGTSNVGVINAGAATNVVTEVATLRAEMRAHHPAFRKKIVEAYQKAFKSAAKRVTNAAGECGKVAFEVSDDYQAFALAQSDPVVQEATAVVHSLKHTPNPRIINGGLDANWMNVHGIPTVTLGVGQHDIHTVKEFLNLKEFQTGCNLALRLALGATSDSTPDAKP